LLKLYKGGKLVKKYKVAIGRNPDGADKKAKGDLRTPEGNFHIVSIHKSDKWLHEGKFAYGPWFLRLKTPWQGIGIHGTDEPESLGKKASEGCIRLHSDCITELKKLVEDQVVKSKKKVKVDVLAKCEDGEDE
ncbi:MAG TPA: L,D-transpeptidase, partial [Candidatus Wallbacteria bacterium]|nr:L,D-transpeptidase [Candidatus Wallbacteria bacterium]